MEDLGAGEILLNCIDNDGVGQGFDCDLVGAVSGAWAAPLCKRCSEGAAGCGGGLWASATQRSDWHPPAHAHHPADAVRIPVIASSGAGAPHHFSEVFQKTRAAAALAAGIFHRREVPIAAVKQHLNAAGIPARTA